MSLNVGMGAVAGAAVVFAIAPALAPVALIPLMGVGAGIGAKIGAIAGLVGAGKNIAEKAAGKGGEIFGQVAKDGVQIVNDRCKEVVSGLGYAGYQIVNTGLLGCCIAGCWEGAARLGNFKVGESCTKNQDELVCRAVLPTIMGLGVLIGGCTYKLMSKLYMSLPGPIFNSSDPQPQLDNSNKHLKLNWM